MGWHWGILASSGKAAGAYDLLETTVLSSAASSVTFSSLGSYSDYKHLQLRMTIRDSGSGTRFETYIRFNSDTGSNYASHHLFSFSGAVYSSAETSLAFIKLPFTSGSTAASNQFSPYVIDILDFGSSSKNTTTRALTGNVSDTIVSMHSGFWNNTAAVTTLQVSTAQTFLTGSRFSLFGVK